MCVYVFHKNEMNPSKFPSNIITVLLHESHSLLYQSLYSSLSRFLEFWTATCWKVTKFFSE